MEAACACEDCRRGWPCDGEPLVPEWPVVNDAYQIPDGLVEHEPSTAEQQARLEAMANGQPFPVDLSPLDAWPEMKAHVESAAPDVARRILAEIEQAQTESTFAEMIEAERRAGLPGRTAADLLTETPDEPEWFVPRLIARGWNVKVAGREKIAGKGTHDCYLLGRLERNEPTIYGPGPGRPVTSLILTEEPDESMREKVEAFGLRLARIVHGSELAKYPWDEKVRILVETATVEGREIIYVENVSRSAGIDDEAGVELARAVEKLADACRAARLTLLFDHHHKKGRDSVENMSRGGTALAGATDANLEIVRVGKQGSRRRKLTCTGRMRATNWEMVIELSEDGREYVEWVEPEATAESLGLIDAEDGEIARLGLVDAANRGNVKAHHLIEDAQLLRRVRETTIAEFAKLNSVGRETARKRLGALVAAGLAQEHQPEHHKQPFRWTPVATTPDT
jgi:hypothetical protein